ncbi:SIS domain-containing protein [Lactobacillus sp. ESL0731]|uniref:6-phospho-3-hexuloisomerase n=1 Tax=unclassified Lactobacillus TaxID=2620435 RepID=UPI0023F8DCE2|nr:MULTISPECIES: 6-phospho-3-hexuloisomerase [unclassified Lactobacillus]WEV51571.1 SIS domain-containing protein [Lactobacillus sp. ESL0700]WEV62700.1 SIS domain-containing protein [Lactobacillus sp. ESL0731]
MKNYTIDILNQLTDYAKDLNTNELKDVILQIKQARHIFLAGAGRSGLAVQAFTNRLMHLGYSVSFVGEISSPHSQPGDLLIICSGSGETASLKALAEKAKSAKVAVVLFTTAKDSTIAGLADYQVILPGKAKGTIADETGFEQPMASSFEQLAFLTFDGLVINLMDETGETSASMFARHADFE